MDFSVMINTMAIETAKNWYAFVYNKYKRYVDMAVYNIADILTKEEKGTAYGVLSFTDPLAYKLASMTSYIDYRAEDVCRCLPPEEDASKELLRQRIAVCAYLEMFLLVEEEPMFNEPLRDFVIRDAANILPPEYPEI